MNSTRPRLRWLAWFVLGAAFCGGLNVRGTDLEQRLAQRQTAVTDARFALLKAGSANPRSAADLHLKISALHQAEIALAGARADYFAEMEAELNAFSPEEAGARVREGLQAGAMERGKSMPVVKNFHEPDPFDFSDHSGFVSIFDGQTLKGWEGDPAVWSVRDGAIVGVSVPGRAIRNSYISYRGTEAKDFDLRLELKIPGHGGSGIQYRSAVGIPWRHLPPGAPPLNLQWMMTGPQADFWSDKSYYSGQFYCENNPLGIIAWRGEVVRSVPGRNARLVGRIGNLVELGGTIKSNDWNQYEIIARGGVMMHLINGQLMAVEVDDDPASVNNRSGLIGIEIESEPALVCARNIWLRKLQ